MRTSGAIRRRSRTRVTALTAAAVTAATLTVSAGVVAPAAMQPTATAENAAYLTGPLPSLLDVLGVDINQLIAGVIPPDIQAIINLLGVDGFITIPTSAQGINNTIDDLDFQVISVPFVGPIVRTRVGVVAGVGAGAYATNRAYRALISSASGRPWEGFDPLLPATPTNETNLVLAFVLNPERPNGGILTRFAPVLKVFGFDAYTPPAGEVTSTGIRLNTTTVDVTWAYAPNSDFPVTLNPFAVANSLFAALPTNLMGGFDVAGDSLSDAATAIGLFVGGAVVGTAPVGRPYYFTLNPNDLPLVEPLRLPSRIVNLLTGWHLPTPIADALEPAAKILANVGYTDVVTPMDLANDPQLVAAGYQPYDRTFSPADAATPTPLYSRAPLTFDEWLRVPGDVLTALIVGIVDSIRNIVSVQTWRDAFSAKPGETVGERIAALDPTAAVESALEPVITAMNGDAQSAGDGLRATNPPAATASDTAAGDEALRQPAADHAITDTSEETASEDLLAEEGADEFAAETGAGNLAAGHVVRHVRRANIVRSPVVRSAKVAAPRRAGSDRSVPRGNTADGAQSATGADVRMPGSGSGATVSGESSAADRPAR